MIELLRAHVYDQNSDDYQKIEFLWSYVNEHNSNDSQSGIYLLGTRTILTKYAKQLFRGTQRFKLLQAKRSRSIW